MEYEKDDITTYSKEISFGSRIPSAYELLP